MKIIIIEGENKTGKSTLAKYIVDNYGYEYIKCSQPGDDAFKEYKDIIKSLDQNKNYVIDRFLYGEFVYGPLYRNKCQLNNAKMFELENMIYKDAIIIYCYDSASNIAKRFEEEKEEFANADKIQQALDLFKHTMRASMLPVYKHKMKSDKDLISTKKIDTILNV